MEFAHSGNDPQDPGRPPRILAVPDVHQIPCGKLPQSLALPELLQLVGAQLECGELLGVLGGQEVFHEVGEGVCTVGLLLPDGFLAQGAFLGHSMVTSKCSKYSSRQSSQKEWPQTAVTGLQK